MLGNKSGFSIAVATLLLATVLEPAAEAAATEAVPQTLERTESTWTPEALEELLAPIALYPDVILGQLFVASTNPQEVLDAGNWLLENEGLKGDALDKAAEKVGFTPPIRGLLPFPQIIEMMCGEMGWTAELGQAYVNDQAGVLDAVQRLRTQAKDAGKLASSKQMTVTTEAHEGQQIIIISPPSQQIVYVPQYDPVAAYAPAPQGTVTTTTTTTTQDAGHSTESLVATGLLAFGAGILVGELLDDDDDYYHYYYPNYYGRPMPYYPPYPYRPVYGGGFYPAHYYRHPAHYRGGYNNNYWNRYGDRPRTDRDRDRARSPITAAKPKRRDLDSLNAQARARPNRPAPVQQDSWKGRSSYAGNRQAGAANRPKAQGSYAGARPATTPAVPGPSRPAARPSAGAIRPATAPARAPELANRSALSGANRGGADRAASQRGMQSMPRGVPARARSGGGGGKQRRR